jgi:hypothetical protein
MAFTCSLQNNIPIECRQAIPGITSVLVCQVADLAFVQSGTTGVLSSISLPAASGKKFFRYDFEKYTGKVNQDLKANSANGVISVDQTVDIQLTRYEAGKRSEILIMAQKDVAIITINNDGSYWLFGATKGLTLTDAKSDFGTKANDFSGWKLSFKGEEPVEAFNVPSSMIPALLLPA